MASDLNFSSQFAGYLRSFILEKEGLAASTKLKRLHYGFLTNM